MTKRKFNVSVPIMLTSATTAGKNLEANKDAFAKDYPYWTSERLSDFYKEIDSMSEKIGIKANKDQREATARVKSILADAVDDGTMVKSQMERGYRNEKARLNELLHLLGFSKNWTKAGNGNQNAMLDLLYTFDNQTNPALREELTGKQVSAQRIDSMKSAAHTLSAANVTQETLKGAAPVITAEMNIRLNEIYDTAIDICTAGKKVFRKDPVKSALFSFKKLSAQQVSPSKPTPPKKDK